MKILIGLTLFVLVFGRGGGRVLGVMMRFFWPLILFYLAYRVAKSLMGGDSKDQVSSRSPNNFRHAGAGHGSAQAPIIEICPHCGHEASRGHKCTQS